MIRFQSYEHIELAYYVLSHLDLGRDAATLYSPSQPPTNWAKSLLRAYQKSPRRLEVQWAALRANNLDDFLAVLPNDELGAGFKDAIFAVLPSFRFEYQSRREHRECALERANNVLLEPIQTLRAELWGGAPPSLEVIHAFSLTVHGRAWGVGDNRRVAVDLGRPWNEALMQIFHEECHPISDPIVIEAFSNETRDTRVGKPGNKMHAAIESGAIELGRSVIERTAPELVPDYQKFCQRYGM